MEVLDAEFDEDAMYAGVRLAWKSYVESTEQDTDYYEIYRVNQDNTRSLLGVSNTTSFYINTLPRTDETNKSTFEVVPVNVALEEGTHAQVVMDWPDNSLPKADFAADVTLAAPGETITFESLCSANTKNVSWTLDGASEESAEGESVSVTYENEAPQFAVDGDITKKWCATGSAPHEITMDLGEVKAVSAVNISHAKAGGESADMNTKSYTILVSEDGNSFEEVKNVTKNTKGVTEDAFAPVNARYVKLVVNKPTQGSDSAARIYEIEVYGLEKTIE